jgi:hypothetical protein
MTPTELQERGLRVRLLEWEDFDGRGARAVAWGQAHYLVSRWSDGRFEISASYPGYRTFIPETERWYPTIEAAKAAAEADYAARIAAQVDVMG